MTSKDRPVNVYHVTANSVNIAARKDTQQKLSISDSNITDLKVGEEPMPASPVESDGAAVFDNEDEPIPKQQAEEQDEPESVKLTEGISMFPKLPVCPGTRVYRGKQQLLGGRFRNLAIKVLPRSNKSEKEADLLLTVEHPNIVRVVEAGYCQGTVPEIFIAMELCAKNLQQFVDGNKGKPFDFYKSFSYSKQLVTAVAYIHSNKIVHRDLKPGNILISTCGNFIKVADLGLGKDVDIGKSAANVTNTAAGTEGFKAPETFLYASEFAYSADIFPLGLNVFFIFTNGKHPFGDNPFRWAVNIMDNKNRNLKSIPQFVKPNTSKRQKLIKVIERMLGPKPDRRPTAEDILKDVFFIDHAEVGINSPTFKASIQWPAETAREDQVKSPGIQVVDDKLKKPVQTSGSEKLPDIAKELRNSHGTGELNNLLQIAECHIKLKSENVDSSIANIAKFITSSGSRSASYVRKLGNILRSNGQYLRSMILYKIAHDLHKKEKCSSPYDELKWIEERVLNIKCALSPLIKEGGRSIDVAIKDYGLNFIEKLLEDVRAVENARRDVRALSELHCLVHITFFNNRFGEYEKCIETGERGVAMMKEHFGEYASNYKRYGWLLHNLGIAFKRLGEITKAEHCYVTAIETKIKALDYKNEQERQSDINGTRKEKMNT